MPASLVYAFASMVILLTAVIHLFFPASVKNKATYTLLAIMFSLSFLLMQLDEAPAFYYLRGYVGDPSITTTLYFGAYLMQGVRGQIIYQPVEQKYLMWLVILAGLFLYPLALGVSQFDPYRLGYQPQILLSVLFFTGLYFWYKHYYFLVFVLTSASLCFTAGLLESNNLWDYFLDPILLLVFSAMLLRLVLQAGIKQVRD